MGKQNDDDEKHEVNPNHVMDALDLIAWELEQAQTDDD